MINGTKDWAEAIANGQSAMEAADAAWESFDAASFALSLMDDGLSDSEVRAKFRDLVDGGRIRVGDLPDVTKFRTRWERAGGKTKQREASLSGHQGSVENEQEPETKPNGKAADAEKPTKKRKPGVAAGPSQATILAAIAMGNGVELFRTPEGDAYADIRIDGHRETWKVNSRGFRYWLRGAYFKETGTAVGNDATSAALDIVEAQAQFGEAVREVYLRVAERDGRIYINLANPTWQAIEIAPGAWRLVDEPPVRFVRKYGMLELPEPTRGGKIADLRKHMRITDEGFTLSVAWLLAALRPRGPYPVLAFTGEQGTAKSTTLKMLRNLVDPNAAPLRAPPEATRDLYVAAINGHVITFDNVSYLSSDVSDAMCRLSTGGGFSARALYTDDEEKLFDGQRPQGLNGIGAVVSRPDLLERTLGVQLEAIPDDARKLEDDLWASFDATRPRILGALYDAVAHGLKLLPEVRPNRLPRMADFARWSVACETAYQPAGTFMMAYGSYIEEAADIALESDIVAQALMEYMRGQRPGDDGHREVETTSGHLLDALTAAVGEQKARNKLWPKTPEGMAAKLTRIAPVLRKIGITMRRLPRQPGTGRKLMLIRDERGNP
jgi:hypothetical protein